MATPMYYSLKNEKPTSIARVDIGVFDPKEIRRMSVVEITESTTYEKNLPKKNSVNDIRMGVVDRRLHCGTCGNAFGECNQHYGHINLSYPIYHQEFLQHLIKILRCVCFWCCKLNLDTQDDRVRKLLLETQKDNQSKIRFNAIVNLIKNKHTCFHCKGKQPVYKKQNILYIKADWSKVKLTDENEIAIAKKRFDARTVHKILQLVSNDDYELLGFNPKESHPSWMIMTVLCVGPPIIRPSITETEGSKTRGQDDLTQKLKKIVQINNDIHKWYENYASSLSITVKAAKKMDIVDKEKEKQIVELINNLQVEIATYMNNEIKGQKPSLQRSGAHTRSLIGNLKGKEGLIRGNLSGKRVNFSARAVIGPDSEMDVHEVGVPIEIAMNLYYPERVTAFNIDLLSKRIKKGKTSIEGATAVIDGDGRCIHLQDDEDSRNIMIQIGWIVHRYIQNGDLLVFNRQPSLHKGSMMAHRVVLTTGRTFKLNLSCTTTYNADYDGDEMNGHIPQSELAKADVDTLMSVSSNIVSAQANQAIISLVQDARAGSFLMTRKNTFLRREQVMDLLMKIKYTPIGRENAHGRTVLPIPAILKPIPLWTGKQIYSLLLPTCIQYTKNVKGLKNTVDECMDLDERHVLVYNGELLTGALCKQTVGDKENTLVQTMFKDTNPSATCDFLSDAQRVVNMWMSWRSLSVGPEDCMASSSMKRKIQAITDTAMEKSRAAHSLCKSLSTFPPSTHDVKKRKIIHSTIPEKELELHDSVLANSIFEECGTIIQSTSTVDNNSVHAMVVAGSKGNPFNEIQMRGFLGQQSVEGQRPQSESESRTLPSFKHRPTIPSLKDFGLITSSYEVGLSPTEFFFHTMGGREGLLDTSCKTADSGYMQRRMIKTMESAQVKPYGLIKNSHGEIIEFCYGNDGLDAKYIEKVACDYLKMSFMEIIEDLAGGRPYLGEEPESVLLAAEISDVINLVIRMRKHKINIFSPLYSHSRFEATLFVPINVERMVLDFVRHPLQCPKGPLSQEQLNSEVNALCNDIDNDGTIETKEGAMNFRGSSGFQLHIRCSLSSKYIVEKNSMNWTTWTALRSKIFQKYQQYIVQRGEMVGALAAQSIGEPSTQMTLNTFHFAGSSEKNVTLGIPRLKELINATKKIKKPAATVYLKAPFNGSEKGATIAKQAIEMVLLGEIVSKIHVEQDTSMVVAQKDLFNANDEEIIYFLHRFFAEDVLSSSAWTMQFHLKKDVMKSKGITPNDVCTTMQKYVNNNALVYVSEYNMDRWTMFVKVLCIEPMIEKLHKCKITNPGQIDLSIVTKIQNVLLQQVQLSGISGIKKANVTKISTPFFDSVTGEYSPIEEWILETEGSNLLELFCNNFVDNTRTISNDMYEVQELLGEHSAMAVIYNEMKNVISFDGTYVNDRHFMRVVRTMTYKNQILAMSRHGIRSVDSGFLMRSTFEEPSETLFESAAFADKDTIGDGVVSESIILGKLAPIGSGNGEVFMKPSYSECMAQSTFQYTNVQNNNKTQTVVETMIPALPKSPSTNQEAITGLIFDENMDFEPPMFSSKLSIQNVSKYCTRVGTTYSKQIYKPSAPSL